jgi:hypothetical protein
MSTIIKHALTFLNGFRKPGRPLEILSLDSFGPVSGEGLSVRASLVAGASHQMKPAMLLWRDQLDAGKLKQRAM